MGLITRPFSYTSGNTIDPSENNSNETTLYSLVNGSISNTNIDASAAIAASKLNLVSGTTATLSKSFKMALSSTIVLGTSSNTLTIGSSASLTVTLPLKSLFIPRGYLAGFDGAYDATSATTNINVNPGEARDFTDAGGIITTATLTVDLSASGLGGLATGSVDSSTWYHVNVVQQITGTVGLIADTGASSTATLDVTGVGYARRISSWLTDGSDDLIKATQHGDLFLWEDPPEDVSTAALGATAVTATLSVPTGFPVIALVNVFVSQATSVFVYVASLDANDEAPGSSAPYGSLWNPSGSSGINGPILVKTSSNAEITIRSNGANTTCKIATLGWIDYRGRFD